MAAVDQEAEGSSRGDPAVEMKDEAMEQVFDQHPGGDTREQESHDSPTAEPSHADATAEGCTGCDEPENDHGGDAGAAQPIQKFVFE